MAASALTKGDWTNISPGGENVWTCTVTATTADSDIYTNKTPDGLDPHKPWKVYINTANATLDGDAVAIPVDLYIGWSKDFALTETPPVVANGVLYKEDIYDDVRTAMGYIQMDPNLQDAEDVAGLGAKCYVPIAPYYIFSLDCASALSAGDCTFKIIQ